MQFSVKTDEPILGLGRVIGYHFLGGKGDEWSFVRPAREGAYPRFHVYVSRRGDFLFFNLHLDQKQPSYGKHTAHSGEYEGPLLEEEAERIKAALVVKNLTK